MSVQRNICDTNFINLSIKKPIGFKSAVLTMPDLQIHGGNSRICHGPDHNNGINAHSIDVQVLMDACANAGNIVPRPGYGRIARRFPSLAVFIFKKFPRAIRMNL